MLEISVEKKESVLYVKPVGEIDTNSALMFEDTIQKNIEGTEKVVIDMKDVSYVSSAGLRVVIRLIKNGKAQDYVTLRNMTDAIRETLELVGLLDMVKTE